MIVPGPLRFTDMRKFAVVSRVSLSALYSCALALPVAAPEKFTLGLEKYGMRTQSIRGTCASHCALIAMTVRKRFGRST